MGSIQDRRVVVIVHNVDSRRLGKARKRDNGYNRNFKTILWSELIGLAGCISVGVVLTEHRIFAIISSLGFVPNIESWDYADVSIILDPNVVLSYPRLIVSVHRQVLLAICDEI